MFKLCIDSPVPDLKDLRGSFTEQLQNIQNGADNFQEYINTLTAVELPNLISLPKPLFSGYSNTQQELVEVVESIKYEADTLTMMGMFKPLAAIIGLELGDVIPKIPTLDFSIIDIINGDINNLQKDVSKYLQDGTQLPYIPTEIFEYYSNFEKESLLALKMILVGYKDLLINTIKNMMSEVMKILKISGTIPLLPIIPSIEQLKQTALESFPEYVTWNELVTSVNADEILNVFGLNAFIIPEKDFIPNYSNYEEYLMNCLNQIKDYFLTISLNLLVDFAESTLSVLGFSFPLFCIDF